MPVFLGVVLLGILVVGQLMVPTEPGDPNNREPRPGAATVTQVIDTGNGPGDSVAREWRDGMTVLDLLRASGARFEVQGSGREAFVTEIEGVANGGRGGAGWQYSVNDVLGEVSAGVEPLESGDRVLWKHGPYE